MVVQLPVWDWFIGAKDCEKNININSVLLSQAFK